jgi:tyrosyl-tRNA synthetase
LKEKLDLIQRNTDEVVKLEEVERLLEEKRNPRAYVGYETSGPVHLGHMTSVQKLLDVQEAGFEPVVLWADRHTELNDKGESSWNDQETREWINEMTDYWQATFESLGLEAEFVKGTEFQKDSDYLNDLVEFSTKVSMNRATDSMGDIADDNSLSVAQSAFYPLMQTLDIPHLNIDLGMGGTDQRGIHMKLARDKLPEIGYEKPSVLHYPLLTSLKGEGTKMSSSKPETMFPLHASEEVIDKRISGAYFDVDALKEYPEGLNENPVMQIADRFIFGADRGLHVLNEDYDVDENYQGMEELYKDLRDGELHPQDAKNAVAEEISDRLQPVRQKFHEEPDLLNPLEKAGYEKPEYVK